MSEGEKLAVKAYLAMKHRFPNYGSTLHEIIEVFWFPNHGVEKLEDAMKECSVIIAKCLKENLIIYEEVDTSYNIFVKDPTKLLKLKPML